MGLTTVVGFILVFGLSFASLFLAYRLQKAYPLKWVTLYLFFLVFYIFSGFINLVVMALGLRALAQALSGALWWPAIIFSMDLQSPFLAGQFILFFFFSEEFLGRRIRRGFIPPLMVLFSLFLIGDVVVTTVYLVGGRSAFVEIYLGLIDWPLIATWYGLQASLLVRSRRLADRGLAAAAWRIGWLNVLWVTLYLLCWEEPLRGWLGAWFRAAAILCYFSANIPALLVLRRFLQQRGAILLPLPDAGTDISGFCREYELSAREEDVVRLLLAGRSNRQIEAELFISVHTVKSHVYSVYQKCGVRSRMQLLNRVRQAQQRAAESGEPLNEGHRGA